MMESCFSDNTYIESFYFISQLYKRGRLVRSFTANTIQRVYNYVVNNIETCQ